MAGAKQIAGTDKTAPAWTTDCALLITLWKTAKEGAGEGSKVNCLGGLMSAERKPLSHATSIPRRESMGNTLYYIVIKNRAGSSTEGNWNAAERRNRPKGGGGLQHGKRPDSDRKRPDSDRDSREIERD